MKDDSPERVYPLLLITDVVVFPHTIIPLLIEREIIKGLEIHMVENMDQIIAYVLN